MQFTRLTKKLLGIAAIVAVIGFMALPLTGCSEDIGVRGSLIEDALDDDFDIEETGIKVKLIEVVADGSIYEKTTKLWMTFTDEIPDLSADDITFSGVTGINKGTLSNPKTENTFVTYSLPISGFNNAGTLKVKVKKSGYNVITDSDPTNIFYVVKDVIDIEGMVRIPAGTFIMGSPLTEPERVAEKETQHSVTITKSFYMGKYLVTQLKYRTVMGDKEDRTETSRGKGDNFPIYNVNWYDALVFCNKLSMQEGLEPVYSISGSTDPDVWINGGSIPTTNNATWNAAVMDINKNGYRLATEAEWEYACRGDYPKKATETKTKPFGIGDGTKMISGMANFVGRFSYDLEQGEYTDPNGSASLGKTTVVGSYEPNNYGLYDMHGNLYEWCWDGYKVDITADNTNPTGVSGTTLKVYRGGYWYAHASYLRSAWRGNQNPNNRGSTGTSFRLVRSGN